MKKIVCELCDGTSFVKEGGMFVCQGCGTSYSAAEAKSMMREVEGDAPVAAPVTMPQVNPNQQQLDNILVLATNAYEADNKKEAENYCNRAIEMDAMCYKAWFLKGRAVGWQSKIDDLRIEEAAHSFCKAIDFAPEEEKEDLKNQASDELKKLGIALVSLRKSRFSGSPNDDEMKGFASDKKTILNSILILLSHGNAVGIPDGYLEEVATLMNEAGVAALRMARNAWREVEHPSKKDLITYLDWNGNICEVFRQAIDTSDKDGEEDIVRYENLIIALEDPIGRHSQKREWNSYWNRYDWVNDCSLSDSAVRNRREEVAECRNKISELKKKIADEKAAAEKKRQEEKQARIKAYWEAHVEEKAKLDTEKAELQKQESKLKTEVAELNRQINILNQDRQKPVPSEVETNELKAQIKDLENRRAGLGIFAGKEKKQINEQIASLRGRVDSLASRVAEEKQALNQEFGKKVAPLTEKKEALEKELTTAGNRLKAIDAILTKDPEE